MAKYEGSVTNNKSCYSCYIEATESNINNETNTSLVTVKFHIVRANWGWETSVKYSGSIVIDGTTYSFSYTPNWPYASSGDVTIATKSKTVTHNTDGSKSCAVSATWDTSGTYSCGTAKASGTLKLTDIPRYVELIEAPNFNLGDSETIQYSNPSGLSMECALYKDNDTDILATYRSCTGSSYTFNFTDEEFDKIYKALETTNYLAGRIYLKGINNTVYKTVLITLTGNQKTGNVNISNLWHRTKRWINVAGSWKRCVRWINVAGVWKRCI